MQWRCPACRTELRPNPFSARPDPSSDYRCHVCRLDLQFDPVTETMQVAPLEPQGHVEPHHDLPRMIPPPFDGVKRPSKRKHG